MKKIIWFIVVPVLTIMAGCVTLTLLGYKDMPLYSTGGTFLWLVFVPMVHIVFFDSKDRWPGLSWTRRLGKVFTFQR